MDDEQCTECGRAMRRASRRDMNGLIWLHDDERLVCPRCLDMIVKSRVTVGLSSR